ncbi:posphoenolpyruvate synthetase regulatory kinase/phosphorylase PpsR [Marinospirillum perlucidum]|uniref:posphoenolpyruvate synthetase regulatory kinase/phosphorylase PpsR n=1 Tax=Marinospirillum perlucidum TaxID=1982602 RepID=UPI000DF3BAEA|nr:pyruvate, water dikinase regulatory protein [Marinospirillum perlucidum]
MKRTAFFISDGTGITAEALGRSLLAQFESIQFELITQPYINTAEKAHQLVELINRTAEEDGARPLLIDTIVDQSIRSIISHSNAMNIDVFSTFLAPLEDELGAHSSYSVGKTHALTKEKENTYKARIDSVHYALDNDDGARTHHYDKADLILVGVSRCGKTPTCIYMALQFGVRAANYPITEDDMLDSELPKALRPYRHKIFGLTIEPERLASIRHERRPNSRYSSLKQCRQEVEDVENLYRRHNIDYIDSTHHSIEEISTRILSQAGIERRFSPR